MNCRVLTYPRCEVRDAFRSSDYDFSIDWLNVRLNCPSIDELKERLAAYLPELPIDDFMYREKGGLCFYKVGEYLSCIGYSSFVISYNLDEEGNIINTPQKSSTYGVFLSLSGDGCRYINSLHQNSFSDFLDAISIYDPHCSRIDIACDILDKDNLIVPLIQQFALMAYNRSEQTYDLNCNLQRFRPDGSADPGFCQFHSVFDTVQNAYTLNVTIGGRDCRKGTLQLYNKLVEVRSGRLKEFADAVIDSVGASDYWYRLEYRCKSYAQKVFSNLLQNKDIYFAFLNAAEGFGDFVYKDHDDGHISRCDSVLEWVSFLHFVKGLSESSIHLVQLVNIPYVPCSLNQIEHYQTDRVPGNTFIHIFRMALDPEYKRRCIAKHLPAILDNPHYKPALEELRQMYGLKLQQYIDDLFFEQMTIFDN